MCHDSRDFDEGFYTTKRLGQSNQLEVAEDLVHVVKVALDAEGNHATETPLLALGKFVLRMGWQTRVDNFVNLLVLLQELGNSQSIFLVALHANIQSHKTTAGEVAVKCGWNSTHSILDEAKLLNKLLVAGNCNTHYNIRVTVDVLGDRVDNEISTKAQWVLEVWAHKSVVDNQLGAMCVCLLSNSLDVDNTESGVGRGLNPNKLSE